MGLRTLIARVQVTNDYGTLSNSKTPERMLQLGNKAAKQFLKLSLRKLHLTYGGGKKQSLKFFAKNLKNYILIVTILASSSWRESRRITMKIHFFA